MKDKEYFDWVENAAVENFKAKHHSADILAKEAALTLTVLLAAMGAGTAYAIKAITGESPGSIEYGAVGFIVYLMALSFWLVVGCMKMQPIYPVFNEPKNLLNDAYDFSAIRRFELENMQMGIDEANARNGKVAARLNRIRLAAIASPLIFLLAAAVHLVAVQESEPGLSSVSEYSAPGIGSPELDEVWGCLPLMRSFEC
ncbi:hypothetical protein [Alcaligenes faecalis]|uniref:hypothetical protein n=1 Tax=Alcaligenes faecalis TaxID=511 RepID=UPI0018FE2CF4|nr:hypothetical protein [Alcaligenes faecalis]